MKSKKSIKKYATGGAGPQLGPSLVPTRGLQPLAAPGAAPAPMPSSPIQSVAQSQVQKQVGRTQKVGDALGAAAGVGLSAAGLGFLAPVATGLIGLGTAAAAKKAAGKLKEPSIETPQAVMQRLQAMSDKTMMDRKVDEYNRQMATGVEALQMGSGREIGALPALMRARQQGIDAAVQEQQARKDQALDLGAQAELQQQGLAEQRYREELAGLQGQYQAGIQGTLASVGQLGSAYIQSKYAGTGQPTAPATAQKGMKTPGTFSHKKNPMAIMAKDGTMVGEMTGGEVILNPEQTQKIAKQSEYMRNLLKKPRFKNG